MMTLSGSQLVRVGLAVRAVIAMPEGRHGERSRALEELHDKLACEALVDPNQAVEHEASIAT